MTNSTSQKYPMSLLCAPDGKLHRFGYDAEDRYEYLSMDNDHYNWYFFRRVNLMLYEKQGNMGLELADEKGLKMPARKVFAMAIRWLMKSLLNVWDQRVLSLRADEIHWVLPVPTTWTVSAKDVLREAANEAGIEGRNLTIVQESVAAAIYCELLCPRYYPNWKMLVDTKYIVTDLEEERISTTVLENTLDGAIKVVYTISDRSIGSSKIDEAFIQMIIEIFGSQTFKTFCDESNCDYEEMLREFGVMKCHFNSVSNSKLSLRLPYHLKNMYEKSHNDQVQDAIERSRYRDVLERIDVKGTTALLMVGTFSEHPLMQDAMKKALPRIDVFTPGEGGLAVIKGAVFFGRQPRPVSQLDEDDVSSDDIANASTCSSSYELGIRKDKIGNQKYASLIEEGEESVSSDYLEISSQRQDKNTPAVETQLENQMTSKVDIKRAPSNDELFVLSRKMDKLNKGWWLLAKLLGLSDKQIDEIERGGGDTVRRYYKMLTAWKSHNAGQEKGSVGYLLLQCDEAGIDREMTDSVFGN